MSQFQTLHADNNLEEIIYTVFSTKLNISGSWGYTEELATIIHKGSTTIPVEQFEHNLASMRTYMEMNMTLSKENCYASININENQRKRINKKDKVYDKVFYTVTAIKEKEYFKFVDEYKSNYGSDNFDIQTHFEKRKEATLTREIIYWFNIN